MTPDSQPERWASDVAPLDRALQNARLQAPLDTTRGVTWDWLPPGFREGDDLTRLVGKRMDDLGFVSVSANSRPPLKFAERPILLHMRLPVGVRALSLAEFGSSFVPEREYLLARGSAWRVTRVYREGRQWVMDCEVEPS